MFRLEVETSFSAAHQLREYQGKCENLHGHNWRVRLTVAGSALDRTGMLVDFGNLKRWLNEATDGLDHVFLNQVQPFEQVNPTSENLAKYLFDQMSSKLPAGVTVAAVTVWESDKCSATYQP